MKQPAICIPVEILDTPIFKHSHLLQVFIACLFHAKEGELSESINALRKIVNVPHSALFGSMESLQEAGVLRFENNGHSWDIHIVDHDQYVPLTEKGPKRVSMDKFEQFWTEYPRRSGKKLGKKRALGQWRSKVALGQEDVVIGAAKNYAISQTALDNFAKDPERWLRDKMWEDWVDGPGEVPTKPKGPQLPTEDDLANWTPNG